MATYLQLALGLSDKEWSDTLVRAERLRNHLEVPDGKFVYVPKTEAYALREFRSKTFDKYIVEQNEETES